MNSPSSPSLNSPGLRRASTLSSRRTSYSDGADLGSLERREESVFTHPDVKIYSFSAAALTNKAAKFPWSSRSEKVEAAGPMSIYRPQGSTAFIRSGTFTLPLMPRSQCWCVDGEAKFAFNPKQSVYRIDLPTDSDEDKELLADFKNALGKIILFERTTCPYQRAEDETTESNDSSPLPTRFISVAEDEPNPWLLMRRNSAAKKWELEQNHWYREGADRSPKMPPSSFRGPDTHSRRKSESSDIRGVPRAEAVPDTYMEWQDLPRSLRRSSVRPRIEALRDAPAPFSPRSDQETRRVSVPTLPVRTRPASMTPETRVSPMQSKAAASSPLSHPASSRRLEQAESPSPRTNASFTMAKDKDVTPTIEQEQKLVSPRRAILGESMESPRHTLPSKSSVESSSTIEDASAGSQDSESGLETNESRSGLGISTLSDSTPSENAGVKAKETNNIDESGHEISTSKAADAESETTSSDSENESKPEIQSVAQQDPAAENLILSDESEADAIAGSTSSVTNEHERAPIASQDTSSDSEGDAASSESRPATSDTRETDWESSPIAEADEPTAKMESIVNVESPQSLEESSKPIDAVTDEVASPPADPPTISESITENSEQPLEVAPPETPLVQEQDTVPSLGKSTSKAKKLRSSANTNPRTVRRTSSQLLREWDSDVPSYVAKSGIGLFTGAYEFLMSPPSNIITAATRFARSIHYSTGTEPGAVQIRTTKRMPGRWVDPEDAAYDSDEEELWTPVNTAKSAAQPANSRSKSSLSQKKPEDRNTRSRTAR